MTMYPLTDRDIRFSTPPDEGEQGAWEEYADRYHDRAVRIVVDFITDTLPTTGTDPTDRETLMAALTGAVNGQDTELVTAWAREVSDEIPSFEEWCATQRGRAA
jgi:hypothetical protein